MEGNGRGRREKERRGKGDLLQGLRGIDAPGKTQHTVPKSDRQTEQLRAMTSLYAAKHEISAAVMYR